MSLHVESGVQFFLFLSPHTLTSVHGLEDQDHRCYDNSRRDGVLFTVASMAGVCMSKNAQFV